MQETNILKPCPNKPNCVSSLANNTAHFVEPLKYQGDWLITKQALVETIQCIPRAQIVVNDDRYLHIVFKSKIFGFLDDVEFLFDTAVHVIHVRSASRLGHYDFGVNRKRVRKLRMLLSSNL